MCQVYNYLIFLSVWNGGTPSYDSYYCYFNRRAACGDFRNAARSACRKHHQSYGRGIALGIKELPDFLGEFSTCRFEIPYELHSSFNSFQLKASFLTPQFDRHR